MMMVSISSSFLRRSDLVFLVGLLTFGVRTTDAFSAHHPTATSGASPSTRLISGNSVSLERNGNRCQQQTVALSAVNNDKNEENQPNAGRSYDFIAIEEADKMVQQERLRNEQEIREMKTLLERQHQELLEFDIISCNVEVSTQEHPDVIDLGFLESEDIPYNNDVESNFTDFDASPFSPPFSTTLDEEEYRQHRQHSHDTAECRTLEISLQQLDEENEDLKDEFNNQRHRHQSDIDEKQRMIFDLRDRFNCVQHELKMEISHFGRAKAELEEMLNQEQLKARILEQQLLLARREQEILEQAAIEAQQQQQQMQEKEEQERQQRLEQLEREEQERKQQQMQQEKEENLHREELLRNHGELAELEKHQKQLDDVYSNIHNGNSADQSENDNLVRNQNQSQREQDADTGDSDGPMYSTQFNTAQQQQQEQVEQQQQQQQQRPYDPDQQHQQQQYQQQNHQQHQHNPQHNHQTFSVAVTTQTYDPRRSKRKSKRYVRSNSQAHGIFMNFNDILV